MNIFKKLFGSNFPETESKRYLSSDWNFELTIPKDWEVLWENNIQNFPWIQPVQLGEPLINNFRTAITINTQVFESDGLGLEPYMNKAENDLKGYFKEFKIISIKKLTVKGWPAAWMHYTYISGSNEVEELNLTIFIGTGKLLGFQFLCESEKGRATKNLILFVKIIRSLNAGSAGIRLPNVKLVGSNSCGLCGALIEAGKESNAMINLESGKLNIVCDECRKKGSL